ncbi:MAG: hypothetical protein E6J56_25105 [Deltaproteobacteria bacterium]|nr:MAG: hypothetical protein E6J56_25105 [Deltaproteobacteria bacterium]
MAEVVLVVLVLLDVVALVEVDVLVVGSEVVVLLVVVLVVDGATLGMQSMRCGAFSTWSVRCPRSSSTTNRAEAARRGRLAVSA